jgi:membrane protein
MNGQEILRLVKDTIKEWQDDQASRLAAGLAYYTAFSMAPVLIMVIAITGLFGGREATQGLVMAQVEDLVGVQGREFVESMLQSASVQSTGIVATVLGTITLLLGALGAFNELQFTLNRIWDVEPKPVKAWTAGVRNFLTLRLLSFSMLLGIGFLLLVSLVVGAVLAALGNYLSAITDFPELALQTIHFVVSLGLITLLFALMFKYIPDIDIPWLSVWPGAAVTAIFFTLGKYLIGLYLGQSNVGTTFGAAGSMMLIMLWIYYSSQIVFLGAEFTQVYSRRFAIRGRPSEHAVPRQRKPALREGGGKPDVDTPPEPARQ